MTQRLETDILRELIDRKHDVLAQLHRLSTQQRDVVRAADTRELLSLLAEKQRYVVGLQKIEQHLAPFRQQDPDRRHWRAAEDRRRCAAVADRCARLLEEILKMERDSETDLQNQRNEAQRRLETSASAQQALSAYATSGVATGNLDLNS